MGRAAQQRAAGRDQAETFTPPPASLPTPASLPAQHSKPRHSRKMLQSARRLYSTGLVRQMPNVEVNFAKPEPHTFLTQKRHPLHQPGQVLGLRRQSGVRGPPDRGAGEGDRGVEQSNASLSHPVYMELNFYNTQIL